MTTNTLLKIGDIAKQTGVSVGTLRYYETLTLLNPIERGDNGYRYYSSDAIQQVQFIKKAQSLGFSLEDIRQILDARDRGQSPCPLVQDLLDDKIEQLESQIKQMMLFKEVLKDYRDLWSVTSDIEQINHEICPLIAAVPLKSNDN